MLFTKKNRIYAEDQQTKEEIKNPEGDVLLKINLRFPNIRCPRNHPLEKDAVKFYKKLREGFEGFCKTELLTIAKEARKTNPEGFTPFSALSKWENTFENDKFISLVLDFSVSDGNSKPDTERKTQIWEKETGRLCSFSYFFQSDQEKKVLSMEICKKVEVVTLEIPRSKEE